MLVTSPQGELTPLGLAPKYQRFRVAGIFHSGFYQYDAAMAFMRLVGRAAALQRAGSALGDQLQGGRSGPRAADRPGHRAGRRQAAT